jgi:hypothetical protein
VIFFYLVLSPLLISLIFFTNPGYSLTRIIEGLLYVGTSVTGRYEILYSVMRRRIVCVVDVDVIQMFKN